MNYKQTVGRITVGTIIGSGDGVSLIPHKLE